jgi:acetylornithine deacetylase/succinyl-diaminopimelate desuccinylase-like protein
MTAACDAWQYNNTAGIPTVVFGPGTLGYAHAKDEQIRFEDMLTAAGVLVDFVKDYK